MDTIEFDRFADEYRSLQRANVAFTATDQLVELSILMPCLNEAATLPACIRKAQDFLDRVGIVGEILVADNGSTDDSQGFRIKRQAYG